MSQTQDFSEVVDIIMRDDPRYARNAYYFVRQALDYTVNAAMQKAKRAVGHITGMQLLEGFRIYALEQFGPMAITVLDSWGVRQTQDVGVIVFSLVEHGVLGKNDKDSIEDFRDVYTFSDAFEKPFQPKKRRRNTIPPKFD